MSAPVASDANAVRRAAGRTARFAFAMITVWIAGAMVLSVTGPEALHAALDAPFDLVCHRIPERVLSIGGVAMPLCSRCAGIWVGLSLGATFAWPRLSVRALRWTVGFAALAMLVDIVTQDAGLHPVFHPTRIATGLFVGVPLGGTIGGAIARELGV